MTIENKIAELKKLYPTLTKGVNNEIFTLNADEYEATILAWAQNEIDLEAAKIKAETDKAALLAKLGITADEAKVLLG
jgi:hypothetical protein